MVRNILSLVTLMLVCLFTLGLQTTSHAQTVGGIFKVTPSGGVLTSVEVNGYYDTTGAPAGTFYIGNATWNFSGGYQYTTLGCGISFGRDSNNNVTSSTGDCYGFLYNYYYVGSKTKVIAHTVFSPILGVNTFSVTLTNYTTKATILTYSNLSLTTGTLTFTN